MNLRFSEISGNQLDRFTAQHPCNNIYQTQAWAQVKSEWQHRMVGLFDQDQLVAAAMILIRSLPLGMKLAYIPRGPIMNVNDAQQTAFFLRQIRQYCRKLGAVECKFDPYLIIGTFDLDQKQQAWQATSPATEPLKAAGARFAGYTRQLSQTIQPRFQLCLHYQPQWQQLLPKKTREKIQSSFERGIEIELGGVERAHDLARMVEMTEQRKHIHLRNEEYFKTILKQFAGRSCVLCAVLDHQKALNRIDQRYQTLSRHLEQLDDKAVKKRKQLEKQLADLTAEKEKTLRQCEQDGQRVLVSALLLVHDGRTCELLYSGLDGRYRRYLAAYALRYQAIAWAFDQQGCTRFNFGGVEGSLDDGLFVFKSSFNPKIEVYLGEFSLPCRRLLYPLWAHLLPWIREQRRQWLRRKTQ